MPQFDRLIADIEAAPDPQARIDALLRGLADRIKATSNDQNVQRLARELRAETPAIVSAVAAVAEV